MPVSSPVTDSSVRSILAGIDPATALDVGVGAGKYGGMLRKLHSNIRLKGIEPHLPYHKKYAVRYRAYDQGVATFDARTYLTQNEREFDLIVFGDVLEHMTWSEAIDVVHMAAYQSRWMLLVWPERRPQSGGGVELERHRSVIVPGDFGRFETLRRSVATSESGHLKHVLLLRGLLQSADVAACNPALGTRSCPHHELQAPRSSAEGGKKIPALQPSAAGRVGYARRCSRKGADRRGQDRRKR